MKILWLAPIPYIAEKNSHPAPWVINLAKLLVKNGHALTIVNYNNKIKEKYQELYFEDIKIIYVKTPNLKLDFLTLYQLRIYKVRNFLKKIISEYDILHIHGSEHQYEVMAYGLKIPKLISIQGIMEECIKYISKKDYKQFLLWKLSVHYESKYLSKYENFSCRTHWDSSHIKSKNKDAKIFMIWEIIRNEFFSDNYSIKKENLLFVGGKNPIKGLKELLIAYNNSIQKLGLKLIILGNCSYDDIKIIINNHNLNDINLDNIQCRGMLNSKEMLEAYNESYCLIHPTYIDNSPNSVCEAQISGLPVIASNVGGVSSLIEDKNTGILINNINEIELAIKILYKDSNLRDKISENSKQIARKRHNPNTILEETIKMYTQIIRDSK